MEKTAREIRRDIIKSFNAYHDMAMGALKKVGKIDFYQHYNNLFMQVHKEVDEFTRDEYFDYMTISMPCVFVSGDYGDVSRLSVLSVSMNERGSTTLTVTEEDNFPNHYSDDGKEWFIDEIDGFNKWEINIGCVIICSEIYLYDGIFEVLGEK